MRYRRYERGTDLPGSRSYIRTGPVGFVWFGAQGVLMTLLILFWPSATLAINYRQWWAWLIFPLVQIFWLWGLWWEIKSSRRGHRKPRHYTKADYVTWRDRA
jgi:hypothetical protein